MSKKEKLSLVDRKMIAEIKKLMAETMKVQAETRKIKKEARWYVLLLLNALIALILAGLKLIL